MMRHLLHAACAVAWAVWLGAGLCALTLLPGIDRHGERTGPVPPAARWWGATSGVAFVIAAALSGWLL